MKVSVIVSTCNSAKFLPTRLQNLLEQTINQLVEIIVINSGAHADERDIVQSFQREHGNILYLETEKEGLYYSWNRAIGMASGDYISNANTDDRLYPAALEVLSAALDQNPDIGLVYADSFRTQSLDDILFFDKTLKCDNWKIENRPDYSHMNLLLTCLCGPQPMWRKSLHDSHGLFDTTFTVAGDYDFWLRVSEDVFFLHVAEALGLVFDNPDGIENRNRRLLFEENKLIRRRHFGNKTGRQREATVT